MGRGRVVCAGARVSHASGTDVSRVLSSDEEVKRGLVLEGGGAKGAYAYGCLRAFHERRVRFDAVSGTSVGALNGLLWATKNLEREFEVWSNLTQDSVFPRRWSGPKSLLAPFFHIYKASFSGSASADLNLSLSLAQLLASLTFMVGSALVYFAFVGALVPHTLLGMPVPESFGGFWIYSVMWVGVVLLFDTGTVVSPADYRSKVTVAYWPQSQQKSFI